ncbi:glycosyltransferase family 2 protein [Reyranella sp.]|uniref:glycosyltransferase family 2 protein n=1 Tax=Reyranella sp. TaxID=1929291 RepID=UPI003BA84BF5
MTDISVIIPTYNRLWSLPQTIDSCRTDGCAVEIVVIDDGSTDGTWEWLGQQRGIVAVRTENWGKDWAVQRAMAIAQGEYVRFLDSDDWLTPDANVEQLDLARRTGADVVVAGYCDYEQSTGETVGHDWVDCDDFIAQQLGECWASHYSAFLFRRAFIRDIPHRQEFALKDDRLFILEVALREPSLAVYRKPGFVHRHHGQERLQRTGGLTRDIANWTFISLFRKILSMLESRGDLTERRKQAALRTIWPHVRTLARTSPVEARDVVAWIRRIHPEFRPPVRSSVDAAYRSIGVVATERLLSIRPRLG